MDFGLQYCYLNVCDGGMNSFKKENFSDSAKSALVLSWQKFQLMCARKRQLL